MASSITDIGTSYASQVASNAVSEQATAGLKRDYSNASDAELMNACKKFEEYFVEQVIKGAQRTTVLDGFASESGSMASMKSMIRDSYAQELAKMMSDQNSVGLAQKMFDQMKKSQGLTIEEVDAREAAKKAAEAAEAESEAEEADSGK